MLQFLCEILPKEIVCEIALFEGRIMRAYLCDYISEVYSGVYKSYFGYRYCLKHITTGYNRYHPDLCPLRFFVAWSTRYRSIFPTSVKKRKPHKFMRGLFGIIPNARLVRERKKLEDKVGHMFPEFKLKRRLMFDEVSYFSTP